MTTHALFALAFCITVFSIQAIITSANDVTYRCCVSPCARAYISDIKRRLAAPSPVSAAVSMSLFPCGNQCWDCETAMTVWMSMNSARRHRRHIYNFDAFPRRKWPLSIPYIFNNTVPSGSAAKATVRGALAHIEARTCIRFNEISQPSSVSHISFGLGSSCVAFVGRTLDTASSPILATANCFTQFGEMLYLVVQNLGLWHVTQRYDRDEYVRVVTENLLPSYQSDLLKLEPGSRLLNTFNLTYDYASLMHFPPKVYSYNGSNTINTLDALYNRTIGQRVQLSFLDTKLINLAYCSGACSGQRLSRDCENGGYQDPNNCNRCLCPDGFGGQFCTDLEPAQGANCGGVVTASSSEQTITSPGYNSPGYYNSQLKCAWKIQAPSGTRIRLRFQGDFGLYCKNSACYHWVEVRYTGLLNNTGPRFCCSHLPRQLTSGSNEALIIFQSNMSSVSTTERRGFQLGYTIVSGLTTNQVTTVTTGHVTGGRMTTAAPPSGGGACDPNPCHNHGRCIVNSSLSAGFTCDCPPSLWGPLCQQGCCGGCGAPPGVPVPACRAEEYPQRMCNVTRWFRRWRRPRPVDADAAGGRRDRWRDPHWPEWRPRIVEVPCTFRFCCDNAEPIGVVNTTRMCAVVGWTNWSDCSGHCGGGRRERVLYEIETHTSYYGQTIRDLVQVNRTTELCNTQVCNCDSGRYPTRRWFFWRHWCSRCNWGFQEQNGTCVPRLELIPWPTR